MSRGNLRIEGNRLSGLSSSDRNRSRLCSLYLRTNRYGLPPSRRNRHNSARLNKLCIHFMQ